MKTIQTLIFDVILKLQKIKTPITNHLEKLNNINIAIIQNVTDMIGCMYAKMYTNAQNATFSVNRFIRFAIDPTLITEKDEKTEDFIIQNLAIAEVLS